MIILKPKLSSGSLDTLKRDLERSKINFKKCKDECAIVLADEAKKLARLQIHATVGELSTGALENSIEDEVLSSELYALASVFTDLYYAFYVEEGTGRKASGVYGVQHRQTPWYYYNERVSKTLKTYGEEGHLFMFFAYSVMESKYIQICSQIVHKNFEKLGN